MSEFLMSAKEYDRLDILRKVQNKSLTQIKAAELLKVSDRQVRNLLKALNAKGLETIISKKRGKPSNHQYKPSNKEKILRLICTKYQDFGPTFASEKLLENEELKVSRETLRKWMIEKHLWIPKIKKKKVHFLRQRKEYFGEMLQGDGSHHDWFENGQFCALIYFIDDATGMITAARFDKEESLSSYAKLLKEQLEKYGKPWTLYTDRFSVFETRRGENLTQFRRMLKDLDIGWIGANSPQAKGRIERCNRTLQDRLVKEMRLRGIKTIEEGNEYLKEYIAKHNQIFSKKAIKEVNLNRPLDGKLDITRTLSRYEERTTKNDLTFQFHKIHYRILESQLSGKKIEIRMDWEGKMRVFQKEKELRYKRVEDLFIEEKKELVWKEKKSKPLSYKHPWKRASYSQSLKEKEIKMRLVI